MSKHSMRRLLIPHPHSHATPVEQIEADIAQLPDGRLSLSYRVTGRIREIAIPSAEVSARGDQLWRHTCFEAFLRTTGSDTYREFNFAPSMRWAAYRFIGYRAGRHDDAEVDAIPIETQSRADSYTLTALLRLDRLLSLPDTSWQLGLSAVIEDTSGGLSYWALAHPPGKPDFHHAAGFAHELSPRMPS